MNIDFKKTISENNSTFQVYTTLDKQYDFEQAGSLMVHGYNKKTNKNLNIILADTQKEDFFRYQRVNLDENKLELFRRFPDNDNFYITNDFELIKKQKELNQDLQNDLDLISFSLNKKRSLFYMPPNLTENTYGIINNIQFKKPLLIHYDEEIKRDSILSNPHLHFLKYIDKNSYLVGISVTNMSNLTDFNEFNKFNNLKKCPIESFLENISYYKKFDIMPITIDLGLAFKNPEYNLTLTNYLYNMWNNSNY